MLYTIAIRERGDAYLQERHNHGNERIGPDAAIERLVQPPLRQELFENEDQREQTGILVDELGHELGGCMHAQTDWVTGRFSQGQRIIIGSAR